MDTAVSNVDTPLSAGDVLFGKTRRAVLALLFGRPDESFHLREVARRSGSALRPVQRELAQLTAAGILVRERVGNQVRFRANAASPIHSELKSLVIKTIGVGDALRAALQPLAHQIRTAFIFGSFARGEHHRDSDIDVMIVGDATFDDVSRALGEPERLIGRAINPVVYTPADFRDKLAADHHFLRRVHDGPKAFLIGGEDELASLGRVGGEPMAPAPNAGQIRNR